ncbi:HD domain-containing protein [Acetobacterium paludosum]|uniref:HD domain-containing protein n=1 Tax=Acetobacterium paludosum TaxID=52693 RepID=A0A923HQ61_9FIRM|nr:ATP-binding protein [Acetobacterium paludosum]MBC3886799.1 HD domain-containing protein [Acetobacterium paludosum]
MKKDIYETQAYQLLKSRNSPFLDLIEKTYTYAFNFLPKINNVFSNYTGHGITHSIRVVEYMFDLCDEPKKLSDLEITISIFVALLHDIGMVASDDEIDNIKNEELNLEDRKYSLVLKKYGNEIIALQECIRPAHAKRSMCHIKNDMSETHFIIPGYTNVSFVDEVAQICAAHNENFEWITGQLLTDVVKGDYPVNSQYIALLLRIADYLDIDEERAPLYLYKFLNPKEYGDQEWLQHFVIENKDKIVYNNKTSCKNIEFYGVSSNPTIHRKLLKYFDLINDELKRAVELSETFQDQKYLLCIKPTILNKIRTKGFNFSDFRLSLDYKAVTSLLMGENIYGNAKYGLRELIQNSIDACKVMQEESKGKIEFTYNTYQPFISIILDRDRKQVSIFDNGRGMSLTILKKYFLNVGVSYYISDDYLLKGNKYVPIGNYGIGFLACFMLSDRVVVITKYYDDNQTNKIEFEKSSEYICLTYENTPRLHGTEIILDYDQFLQVFDNKVANIKKFIQDNFLYCDIPIRIIIAEEGNNQTEDIELHTISSICRNGIVLNSYLNDIEATVEFSYKGINFVQYLSDIDGNQSYIYQEQSNELIKEDELNRSYSLKEYTEDGTINYISVPIISSLEKENYEKAFDVLEDFNEVLEKIDYESIDILTLNKELYNVSSLVEHGEDCLVGEFCLKQLCHKTDHAYRIPTQVNMHNQKIIQGSGEKILPYNMDKFFRGEYLYIHTDQIYIKYVFISDVQLKVPYLLEGIQLKSAVINILNKNIIPTVSRNNINKQQNLELAYAIGKALHLWILDHGEFTNEEKILLKNFINTCYPKNNYCLRKNEMQN